MDLLPSPDLHIVRASPIYETEPVDCADEAWFLNLVLEARA